MYQFAVFQFSSPPKNIGSTRAEEIFCRKEFFLSSAVWGWSSGYVSRLSLQQIFYPPRHFLWDTVFFLGGRWIRQNYGCYVLREHAKLLTFTVSGRLVKEEKNIPNKFRSLSFQTIRFQFSPLKYQQEAQLEVFESPLIETRTEVILTRSQQV